MYFDIFDRQNMPLNWLRSDSSFYGVLLSTNILLTQNNQILDYYDLYTSICYKGGGGGGGRAFKFQQSISISNFELWLQPQKFSNEQSNGNFEKHSDQRDISAFSEISKV